MIYLDNNSTTYLHPEVAAAMDECQRLGLANPASQHAAGRKARRILEDAKLGLAEILGAKTTGMDADQLIVTSGGTESNNLALRGLMGAVPGRVLVSSIEHPSVHETVQHLKHAGHTVSMIEVDGNGVVQLERLPELWNDDVRLVSVMLGNNETGVLQPVRELAAKCKRLAQSAVDVARRSDQQFFFHSDAVQCVGKIPVHFRDLGVDALSFSAHKFHGPPGVGGLLIRSGVKLQPLLHGGVQQAGLRPGTEPVALVIGMYRALQLWHSEQQERVQRLRSQRDFFEAEVRVGFPEVVIQGSAVERLPHTSNLAFPGVDRQALVMALDLEGIACSTGSACASGSSEPSPVLLAMRLPQAIIEGSIRVSLSTLTTHSEVIQAAHRISHLAKDLRRQGNANSRLAAPPKSAVPAV